MSDQYKDAYYENWITECTEAIKLNPNDAVAYFNRGLAKESTDDYNGAITDYSEAIRLDPNYAVEYLICRAGLYCKKGDYDKAVDVYTEAIREVPNDAAEYLICRAGLYCKKGDYDKAIADYTEAIREDPNDAAEYLICRADLYCKKGDYDKAIADYTEAIFITSIESDFVRLYRERGNAYLMKGDKDKGNADLTEAKRLERYREYVKELKDNLKVPVSERELLIAGVEKEYEERLERLIAEAKEMYENCDDNYDVSEIIGEKKKAVKRAKS